ALAQSPLAWAIEQAHMQPYPYQARLLADRSQRVLVLKARQVGISYAAAVLAAHHLLYHPSAVVLVVSRDQGAAGDFARQLYAILDNLDESPVYKERSVLAAVLANGNRLVCQPATAKAGRGLAATLVIADEFAFTRYDSLIYKAISPTLSRGGRLIVISTPDGIANLFYRLWFGMEGGDWRRYKVHWSECPIFGDEWYQQERPKYTDAAWASEYDLDFSTSGQAVFNPNDIDAMAFGWFGEQPAQEGHTYYSGWDIGRRRDATVGVTVDATTMPYQVVKYERLLRAPFATIQASIKQRAQDYPGQTSVESNSIGDPVIEGLTGVNVTRFTTTQQSNANGLQKLVRMVEQGGIKAGQEQLLSELRSYQWDDSRLIQDSVMALMITCWPVLELHGPRLAPTVVETAHRAVNASHRLAPTVTGSGGRTTNRAAGLHGSAEYRYRGRRHGGQTADATIRFEVVP
ncbi:MAG: terminase family protein, partial [Dehalococcoidia bacterium]